MSKSDNAGPQAGDPDFLFDPSLAAADAKIKLALSYWNAKRGKRFAPARGDIEIREAKDFAPHLQIYEMIDGGRAFRPRLVGTAIAKILKENTTGQVFDDTSPELVVRRTLRAMRWVLGHKKPLRTFAPRTALAGQDFLAHETVFLPLSSDGETIDMMAVVGVFTPAS